ncbi:50S ribosomal protein L21 [bacterium]|nr:50S ribosomal protein L21 [bacterium]
MYAIFEAGGRQHRAETGKVVKMDRLDAQTGDTVEFDKVLAVFDGDDAKLGEPYLSGVKVVGRVMQQGRDRKIIVFKYKPKSGWKRTRGHRQHFTQVQITEIAG